MENNSLFSLTILHFKLPNMSKYLAKFEHLFCPEVGAQNHVCAPPAPVYGHLPVTASLCSQKNKNVKIEVQNVLLSRSPQRLDPNFCQHARYLIELH